MKFFKRRHESRTETEDGNTSSEATLLEALIGKTEMTKEDALSIPSLKASVDIIANTISSITVKLYKKTENGVEEIKDDPRVRLLNGDTHDTLSGTQFIKAMVKDYLLTKGAYAYIDKQGSKYKGIHYVKSEEICINHNTDPIFKDYTLNIQGGVYFPYQFIKFLRNTENGYSGKSVIDENSLALAVAYNSLVFENNLVKKGGNKKGFLKSATKLSQDAIDSLKAAWKKLYSNNSDNVVVLNEGMEFQEASNTSVEMQLNENKLTNSEEVSMLLNVPNAIVRGKATEQDVKNFVKFCIIPILNDFECSLDRDFLLEKEKENYYWAFDTKDLTRGSIKERFEAYKMGIDANFLQIDEVREYEDLEKLGLDFIKLGLADVLYNPKTKEVYTPNTGQTSSLHSKGGENE